MLLYLKKEHVEVIIENNQQKDMDKWREVRQSKKIRGIEEAQLKTDDPIRNKGLKEQSVEGNHITNQNSFPVLNHSNFIELAMNMGIHSDSITFEKIDVLKDW